MTDTHSVAVSSATRGQGGLSPVAKRRIATVIKHVILIAVGFVMIFPLLWMVSASLKPDEDIFKGIQLIPTTWDLNNYKEGWYAQTYTFGHYMMNSLIITVLAIVGNLISCSMAAYGFARLKWRGRSLCFSFMMMHLMLPFYVTIVPQYIMWSKLDLVNTFVPLVLPKFLATDAFFVFLMVQFFRGLPTELDEAAEVDGAGFGRIFFQILLPNALPSLATTGIFTFINTWNDFFSQFLYLTKPQNLTATVALRNFSDATSGTSWGPLFAMSTLSLIPLFFVFLFGQKYLVEGSATTGMKG